jgi:hypothetical protein
MFAMTPLKANTGWIKREIWRKRESPDITVAKWSIHDNKALSKKPSSYFLEGTRTTSGDERGSSVTSSRSVG